MKREINNSKVYSIETKIRRYPINNCPHKRKKKNYPFGRNSEPIISCEDCGKVLSKHELMKNKQEDKRNSRRRR